MKITMKEFKTIKENATSEIEERRSKFISNIFYVETEEEANEKIKNIKKQYYDAKHNCFAYIINKENQIKRFSDDGEPSGTAGSPILNVIEKNELCNVLIIITRYFGGILLGAGGLVRAYTEAASKAVEKAGIEWKVKGCEIELIISYQDMEKLKYYCNKNNIKILNMEYNENVKCIIEVTNDEKDMFLIDNKYNEKMPNIQKFNIIKEKYIRKQRNKDI